MDKIKWIVLITLLLAACGGRPADQVTAVPTNSGVNSTQLPTSIPSTLPATNSSITGPAAASIVPSPSTAPLTPLPLTATISVPRPRPASSGPLTFTGTGIYVANCRFAVTTDKPGGIVIQISVEVTGGDGTYQYFDNNGKQWPTKFIDVGGEKGTQSIGKVTVTSGDGQTVMKEYNLSPGDLTCS